MSGKAHKKTAKRSPYFLKKLGFINRQPESFFKLISKNISFSLINSKGDQVQYFFERFAKAEGFEAFYLF